VVFVRSEGVRPAHRRAEAGAAAPGYAGLPLFQRDTSGRAVVWGWAGTAWLLRRLRLEEVWWSATGGYFQRQMLQ
jgi:hypothetical protein